MLKKNKFLKISHLSILFTQINLILRDKYLIEVEIFDYIIIFFFLKDEYGTNFS